MNLTLEQFIEGLERSARELPGVLADWADLDDELRDEYTDQLLWLLSKRAEVQARASREGRFWELAPRIAAATSTFFDLRDQLRALMGIPVDKIVPYTAYTEQQQDGPSLLTAVG
jgi:hypothetical protein